MNKQVFIVAAILLALASFAHAGEMPKEAGYYQGTIGRHPVVMTLGPNLDGNAGQYRYLEYGPAIGLKMQKGQTSGIALEEMSGSGGHVVAHIRGLSADESSHGILGNWTSVDGRRTLPIDLQCIAEMKTLADVKTIFAVETSYPRFEADTPFYRAVNTILATRTKWTQDSRVADMTKATDHPQGNPDKLEDLTTMEVLHADGTMVSLLEHTYKYLGNGIGVGVDDEYRALTYVWRDGHTVELKVADLIAASAAPHITAALTAQLTGNQSSWSAGADISLSEQVINPTSAGLLFTFSPNEAEVFSGGSSSVLLSYRTVAGDMPDASPVQRLASAHHANRRSPFVLTTASAMERVMSSQAAANLKRAIPSHRLMDMMEDDQAPDHIDLFLGDDEGDHTNRIGSYRVTSDGRVWVNADYTKAGERWVPVE